MSRGTSTLSFDLKRSLRRFKPERRTTRSGRRPDAALPFVGEAGILAGLAARLTGALDEGRG